MAGLLDNFARLNTIPSRVIIVDSSDDDSTFGLLSTIDIHLVKKISYLKSTPGLPHQRNVGVREILSNHEFDQVQVISFTDDDCRLVPDYFEYLAAHIKSNLNYSAITGVLVPMQHAKSNLWRRIFFLDSKSSGSILKSGYTTPIQCTDGICEVDWIPGGSMNIKRKILETSLFDSKLRMYGEDLKMSLKLKEFGPLLAHSKMEYEHLEATSGKDNLIDVISFTDGIRWQLSTEFPDSIKRRYVLLSIIGSVMANSIGYLKSRNSKEVNKSLLLGHLQFLSRLVRRTEYIQVNQ
jgi:GT2 family glycosyltransferase